MDKLKLYILLILIFLVNNSFSQEVNWLEYYSIEDGLKEPEKVGYLILRDKELQEFPKEILKFKYVRKIDIQDNNITSIPKEIEQLTYLEELIVQDNQIESLPETIGNIKSLKRILARDNNLTKLPESIGGLSNLKTFYLGGNNIQYLPISFKNLKSLEILDIRSNPVSNASTILNSLSNLLDLNVAGVKLDSSVELNELKNLKHFAASEMMGFPKAILNLDNLQFLYFYDCDFNQIPKELTSLKNLKEITMRNCKISSFPIINELTQLKRINLERNEISDISGNFENCTSLKSVRLRNNPIEEKEVIALKNKCPEKLRISF